MRISLSGQWKLKGNGREIAGHVPGDVTNDFFLAGLIEDPYYDENYKDALWITQSDWTYEREFIAEGFPAENARLHFDGIDTFAEISVNGVPVGKAANMHKEYDFPVGPLLREGKNTVTVRLQNVYEKMGRAEQKKYDSIFCANRIFVRKAQCHFGWDWAPRFPGYGIYRDVWLISERPDAFEDVQVRADADGNACFRIACKEKFVGVTEVSVFRDGACVAREEIPTACKKFLVNLRVENPELWWPNGYGEQPLYEYSVRQKGEGGEVLSERRGKFGFRSVELSQKAIDRDNLGFALKINGRKIFCRGSNWVPADCMTGRMEDGKYRALVQAAKEANMNMLRVWGGGIYEKNCFYEYCDEAGIMVWQEFMFSCSEIPEDDPPFVKEITEEAVMQVRRLRNHPSVVLWCGMNEIRGSFCETEERFSVFTLHYLLRGIVASESPDTPYIRCSPFAFADTENDLSEGDCHNNLSERCLFDASFKGFDDFRYDVQKEGEERRERIVNYERFVVGTESNFLSECAVLGMCNYESLLKFAPESKLTTDSPFLEDRFLGNPYTYVMPMFFERQKTLAEGMYGKATDVRDLVKKIGRAQADVMETEIVYARVNGRTNGFLSWMFDDIWPTGTWSVVDYYLSRKPAYYAMKRCFAPLMAEIVRIGDGYFLCAANDGGPAAFSGKIVRKDYSGKAVGEEERFCEEIPSDGSVRIGIADVAAGPFYLSASGTLGGKPFSATYDLGRYGGYAYDPLYTCEVERDGEGLAVILKAETYLPCVRLEAGEKAAYEDNYFHMDAGQEKRVRVIPAGTAEVVVRTFADPWDGEVCTETV